MHMVRCFLFYMVISSVLSLSRKSRKLKKEMQLSHYNKHSQDHMNDYFNAEFAFALVPDLSPNHVFCYFTEISVIPVTMAVAVSIY